MRQLTRIVGTACLACLLWSPGDALKSRPRASAEQGWDNAEDWFWSRRSWVTPEHVKVWEAHLAEYRATGRPRPRAVMGSQWTPLGPRPIGGFQEFSGRVLSVATHPADANLLLVGSARGGVWRSTDAGQSWVSVLDDMPYPIFDQVWFDPVDPRIAYAADSRARLFQSLDGGVHWTQVSLAALPGYGALSAWIRVMPDGRTLGHAQGSFYAVDGAFGSRVSRFDSGGRSATVLLDIRGTSTVTVHMRQITSHPATPLRLVALAWAKDAECAGGCWRSYTSEDAGVRWSHNLVIPAASVTGSRLNQSQSDPNSLVASFGFEDRERVLLSRDGGITWKETTSPAAYAPGAYGGVVSFGPTDPNELYFGHLGFYRSTDAGVLWSNLNPPHADEVAVAFDSAKRLILASDGGVARYEGSGWTSLNRGLDITQAYSVTAHPTYGGVAASGTQDTGTLQFLGPAGWTELTGGDGGDVAFDASAGITYSETQWSGGAFSFYRCRSNPAGCTSGTTGLDKTESAEFIPRFAMDPSTPSTLWFCATRLYKTENRGDLWVPMVSAGTGRFTAVAVAPSNGNIVYAGTSAGRVLVSGDRGQTWEDRASGLGSGLVEDFAVSPLNSDVAYVAKGGRVYRTMDRGRSWADISANLPVLQINTVAIESDVSPHRIYIGTDIGVYRTVDQSSGSWSYFNDGMPPVQVMRLSYSQATSTLLAATYGRGIWSISTRFSR